MHGADIQAALRKAGTSQTQVAFRLGVTKQAVHGVVWDDPKGRSIRIARAISRTVGLPVSTLWPGVYAGAATRRRRAA